MSKVTERFIQAGEYRTHYWEVGEGENVLMLHSADPGSGGWLEFRENMEALGKQFRVLAPDIIGFGKTDSPKSDLRHPAYVEHMLQFLDALGVKKTHLIGNCRGGLISISIAAEHPDRVGRLILIGNAGGGIPPELEQKALAPYANYTATRENLQAHLGRAYFNPDRWAPPQIFDQYLEASARQYGSYAKLGCYPMDVPNLRPLLAKMTVPVLFVTGKENKILPIEQALIAFNMTPGAKLYAMSSCGLHAQTEHPQEFNRIAVEFLKGELN